MKEKNKLKKVNSKPEEDNNIKFLKDVKKEAKKEKISYNLRFENYSNPDKRLYTYGIR